jgi:hypothetical protein
VYFSCVCRKRHFFRETLILEVEFRATIGWQTRFKEQCYMCEITVQGERERLDASDTVADTLCNIISEICTGRKLETLSDIQC